MHRILATTLSVLLLSGSICFVLAYRTAAPQPQLTLYKTADRNAATPGDTIFYTIYFENMGPQVSPIVWINDTLPEAVEYVNDTAYTIYGISTGMFQYSVLAGNILSTMFKGVATGNHSFLIEVNVAGTTHDGQVLSNTARMNYTSATMKVQNELSWTVDVMVSMPIMHLSNSFLQDPNYPSLVNFTLLINNSGSAASWHFWLNDTLPEGFDLIAFQASPQVTCAQVIAGALNCTRDDFSPGVEIVILNVRITPSSPPGLVLVNSAHLDYTDQDGSLLAGIFSNASFFTQTAIIDPSKMVDQIKALPGARIHYSIYYNNTGDLLAKDVWINDTLPVGISMVNVSPTPDVNITGRVEWHLKDIAPGTHAIAMEVLLSSYLANGTVLANQLTVDYFDEIGRKLPRSTRVATTTVAFDIPSIRVVKTASTATIKAGGQIAYVIFYNNTGSSAASTVTIDDEMPMGVHILSSDPSFNRIEGSHYLWEFTNVSPGIHQITITVRADPDLEEGTSLVNTASVSYTDRFGQVVGSNFMSAVVDIVTTTPEEESRGLPVWMWPLIVLTLLLFIMAGLLYRTTKWERKSVIDDVFLLHKDGLLIRHFTRRLNPNLDSDIMGGMLIAVQNFVNESFASDKGLAKEDGLDQLKFGKHSILIARGKFVVVAAVVSGESARGKVREIRSAIADLEGSLGTTLESWRGDMGQVKDADGYIQDLMAGKYAKRGRSQEYR